MKVNRTMKKNVFYLLCAIVGTSGFLAFITSAFTGNKTNAKNSNKLVIVSPDKLKKVDFKGAIAVEENDSFERYKIVLSDETENFTGELYNTGYKVVLEKASFNEVELKENTSYGFNEDVEIKTRSGNIEIVFPTTYEENFVYKHPVNKNEIYVLIAKKAEPYSYNVTLDPGHGGIDSGAHVGELYEKDVTLKIAEYMKMGLIYGGSKIVMTRTDDEVNPDERKRLREITDIANKSESNIFVSIHLNSFENGEPKGVTTYYYTKGHEEQAKDRERLAKVVQNNLISKDGWKDNSIKTENLQVLRDTKMPSILVEAGYISNPEDRGKLQQDKYLFNIAESINAGIFEYFTTK
ncbi:N-acetylmuramoyl-L-alanine amidase family protein [Clostridium polynesiense]|uniref:N-acetylmuramoyl-L-alanine amidase family protein n=1 Tax=Clostridium polynesiense TaxID=1325933 RepID=UPI0006933113|nr:N-acetylmuramoyl-L-alanine amidase [Clostridium polynesiense]